MDKYKNYRQSHKACTHIDQANENILIKTEVYNECKNNVTRWIALEFSLTCGHVGCYDYSVGWCATRHFKETEQQVVAALPNKSWKWCYVHKLQD
ncbi:MAG: UBP-type zinc finger domain-containing protein [Thermoproteota archaeon]|nr:UBP-type zinc finger domain-containing protein [Thermoproteota archaeon]